MNETPDWFFTGRTILITKDKEKGNDVTNSRPIICLPLMWKVFTGMPSDKHYYHFESEIFLPEEQKECQRKLRGTKDQLLIDKAILKNYKGRLTGVRMIWINSKEAYGMVSHS